MMQDSTTETVSNGPANQNGGANMDSVLREGTPKSATPLVDVTAADLLHLQQHQVHPLHRPIPSVFTPVFTLLSHVNSRPNLLLKVPLNN
uniref:Uncharacterized protein n=1 Tax=Poecilia mexicana TaxID=48701 RepID=A0A3B3XZB2_9TELE